MRYVGRTFIFNYPREFVTLPDYSQRRGQRVQAIATVPRQETDFRMYRIRAQDGWEGVAYPDELAPIKRRSGIQKNRRRR